MGQTIQIRRGEKANLPTLQNGELGLTQDTQDVYVGTPSGNVQVGGASVTSQLADIAINVKRDYRAVGDWNTDDTTFIQNALNFVGSQTFGSKSGGTVFITLGTFRISSNLIVPSNVTVIINQTATLKLTDNAPIGLIMLDCRNSDNIHIYGGGVIDCNSTGVQPSTQKNHGISLISKNVLIEDITIQNVSCYNGSMGDGINCQPTSDGVKQCVDITIKNCHFDNVGRQDIAFESGINCLVDSNFFENGNGEAVDCEPSGYTIGLIDGIIITNNRCKNKQFGGFFVVSESVPTKLQNVTIGLNQFYGCGKSVQIRSAKHVTVAENKFIDSIGDFSINIFAQDGATNEDIDIHDNTLTGNTTYGIRENIVGTGTNKDVRVNRNKVKDAQNPIYLETCTDLTVTENDVDLSNANVGIYINLGTNVVTKDNKVKGGTGTCIKIVNSTVIDTGNNTLLNGTNGMWIQACAEIFWNDNKCYNQSSTKFVDGGGNTKWHGEFTGTFTMTNTGYQQNVVDKHVETYSIIILIPINKDAVTLMASSKALYNLSASNVVNSSFRVITSDSTNPTGSPQFSYRIINA